MPARTRAQGLLLAELFSIMIPRSTSPASTAWGTVTSICSLKVVSHVRRVGFKLEHAAWQIFTRMRGVVDTLRRPGVLHYGFLEAQRLNEPMVETAGADNSASSRPASVSLQPRPRA